MKYRMHQGLLVHCRYFYANMNCLRFSSSSAPCAWDAVTSLHLTVLMKHTTQYTQGIGYGSCTFGYLGLEYYDFLSINNFSDMLCSEKRRQIQYALWEAVTSLHLTVLMKHIYYYMLPTMSKYTQSMALILLGRQGQIITIIISRQDIDPVL